jgi:hypothetical protein
VNRTGGTRRGISGEWLKAALRAAYYRRARLSPLALGIRASAPARWTIGRMKSREEQLTWAKHRALICVDVGHFSDAVAGLRADLDENPLTKGVVSSDQARRGYKAATDAALGRGSQALTEWIEGFR